MRKAKVHSQGRIVAMFPPKRRGGLSQRAYQAKLDRCRLWDLVCMRTPQTEIAQIMGKDPAWVSRTVKEIQADFSTVYATPTEEQIIRGNLACLESLYSEALKIAHNSVGYSQISALRAAAQISRQLAEYQVTVGWVANRRNGKPARRGPTMEELRDEISTEDLERVVLTIADSIEKRRAKVADAKKIPALPMPAETGN